MIRIELDYSLNVYTGKHEPFLLFVRLAKHLDHMRWHNLMSLISDATLAGTMQALSGLQNGSQPRANIITDEVKSALGNILKTGNKTTGQNVAFYVRLSDGCTFSTRKHDEEIISFAQATVFGATQVRTRRISFFAPFLFIFSLFFFLFHLFLQPISILDYGGKSLQANFDGMKGTGMMQRFCHYVLTPRCGTGAPPDESIQRVQWALNSLDPTTILARLGTSVGRLYPIGDNFNGTTESGGAAVFCLENTSIFELHDLELLAFIKQHTVCFVVQTFLSLDGLLQTSSLSIHVLNAGRDG